MPSDKRTVNTQKRPRKRQAEVRAATPAALARLLELDPDLQVNLEHRGTGCRVRCRFRDREGRIVRKSLPVSRDGAEELDVVQEVLTIQGRARYRQQGPRAGWDAAWRERQGIWRRLADWRQTLLDRAAGGWRHRRRLGSAFDAMARLGPEALSRFYAAEPWWLPVRPRGRPRGEVAVEASRLRSWWHKAFTGPEPWPVVPGLVDHWWRLARALEALVALGMQDGEIESSLSCWTTARVPDPYEAAAWASALLSGACRPQVGSEEDGSASGLADDLSLSWAELHTLLQQPQSPYPPLLSAWPRRRAMALPAEEARRLHGCLENLRSRLTVPPP